MVGRAARVGCVGRRVLRLTVVTCAIAAASGACAESLPDALAQAYQNNPQLNAERARQRATDENVPQALSGYRPQFSATANVGAQYFESNTSSGRAVGTTIPRGVGITGTQTIFNGFRTANRTR